MPHTLEPAEPISQRVHGRRVSVFTYARVNQSREGLRRQVPYQRLGNLGRLQAITAVHLGRAHNPEGNGLPEVDQTLVNVVVPQEGNSNQADVPQGQHPRCHHTGRRVTQRVNSTRERYGDRTLLSFGEPRIMGKRRSKPTVSGSTTYMGR